MLAGYILEAIILVCWYLLILKNGLLRKHIIIRTIKLVFKLRYIIIKNIFGVWNLSERQKNNFANIKIYLAELFFGTVMLSGYVLFGPVIIYVMMKVKTGDNIVNFVFALLVVCGLLIKKLKETTQQTIILVNNYTENVMLPLEHNPALIEIDDTQRITVKWTKKKIIFLAVFIIISLVFSGVLYILKDKKELQAVSFIILIFYFVIDFFRSKRKTPICVEQEIKIEGYILESVKDEILEMCKKLNISAIYFKMWNDNNINADSSISEEGIPQIRISNGFINAISANSAAREILLVTIGHELGHIFYRDNISIKKRIRIANFIALIGCILIMLLLYGSIRFSGLLMPALIVLIIEIIFGNIMTDLRYWGQISELKADRIAIQLYASGKDAFIDFWKNKCNDNNLQNYNIVYQYYKRYIENEAHPYMYRRMKILETREKWRFWEYFEHALIIRKWKLTNKGWNGK